MLQQVDKHHVYIDGQWTVSTGRDTLSVINPATEEIIAETASGTAEDVAKAAECARRAFPSWSQRAVRERCDWLDRLHRTYVARADEVARVITAEMGAPLTISKKVHTDIPGDVIADTVRLAREYAYSERFDGSLIEREAYGVIGAITPWNNPIYMMFLKAIPALAAGCTVVHKPAEASPLSAQLVAKMLSEVELPRGVYNLITGTGDMVGSAISSHADIDLISFTGSTRAGSRVAANAAKSVKRTVLELGGKSANVVLDDADLNIAVENGMRSAFNNAGQMCGAWTRMVVPRSRIGEVTERCVAIAKGYVVGDPLDPETTVGPVVSAKQRDTIIDFIRSGIQQGATLALGGPDRPKSFQRGFYVQPTIFTNVDNSMTIAQEEIFGPVLSIIPHDGDEHAIRIANDSKYGLRGAVFSRNEDRALAVARRLRTGQVDINGYKLTVRIPFGGYKQSGYGRCQGRLGFEEFLQIKSVQL
jgi:aldehyde dehydrogenase (NAD+)